MRRLPTRAPRPAPTTGRRVPSARAVRRTTGALALVVGVLLGLVGGVLGGLAGGLVDATPAAASGAQTTSGSSDTTPPGTVNVGRARAVIIGDPSQGVVNVVTINGLIDPIVERFLTRTVEETAQADNVVALVLNLDLEGSVISDEDLVRLIVELREAPFPVDIWIGPTGAQLTGKATWLVAGADNVAMAPGTSIGAGPRTIETESSAVLIREFPELFPPERAAVAQALLGGPLDAKQARDAGITNLDAPVLGDFFVNLPGVQVNEVEKDGVTRREPVTSVVFSQLSLVDNFFHTVASPAVTYLLLAIGMALLIFELFTAGVGVAGVIGAGSFVLGCYGLVVLPNHWYGIALLVGSMLAFAVDVQTGVPRVWTGIGFVAFALGSLTLNGGGVSMSWITITVGLVAVALTFGTGMPSMVRTRFSTPTIGREWMIGEMGRAVTDISPNGVVEIKGAQWRATTNRATPIEQLDRVRVTGIEGLVLEVEPEEGGARDYRERRPKDD